MSAGRTGVRAFGADPLQPWSGSIKRLDELDSLRGLAALSVVLYHFKVVWLDDAVPGWTPHHKGIVNFLLLPVSAGHEAVILFFVLSGFVLALPAVNLRPQTYRVFVVRRIFRIYFPCVAALVLGLVASMLFYGDVTRSRCLGDFWSSPVDWNQFGQHLLFLGRFNTDRFDPPVWTLVYEMRISLVFPILCLLALRLRPRRSLTVAVCGSAIVMIAEDLIPGLDGYQDFLGTLHFAALFVVGIYLARERESISEAFSHFSRYKRVAIFAVSALLYFFGWTAWIDIVSKHTHYAMDLSADWITAVGAAGIIVVSLNSGWWRRGLLWWPVHALGKMSYSVYLLHFIVMLTTIHILYGKLPLSVIFLICLVVMLAASWMFYLYVEVPCISLGRKLSGYV